MKVLIEIPKEFEEHFNNDRFKDSLERVCTDIDGSSNFWAGLYESEVIKMLKDVFIKAEVVKDMDKLTKAKEIIQKLIANAPDTYSGTDIELQQKKMFTFQDAVNKAEQFILE